MSNMMQSPLSSQSEPAKVEQVITEVFAKSLHIILESRSPYVSSRNYGSDQFMSSPSSSSSLSSSKPRDKWFNLALKDCPAALENFDIWRQSNLDPLVIDVILLRRPLSADSVPLSPGGCLVRNLSGRDFQCKYAGQDEFGRDAKSEKIVERWIVQYESQKNSTNTEREIYSSSKRNTGPHGTSSQSYETMLYKKTYKKSLILLRSLYVFVRLLPAYKLFNELNSSGRIRPFSLSHRISSFAEPFTRAEDAEMLQFAFTPIDTSCGRLTLSVSYLPTLEDLNSEPSTPLSTQFIMDYVGSPTTDPVRRFQSLPSAGSLHALLSVSRRHSWSSEQGNILSPSPSQSPRLSDSQVVHYNSPLPPRSQPHDNYSTSSVPHIMMAQHKSTSFDDHLSSPPFSLSSSPSPTHAHAGHELVCSESAPVNIPWCGLKRNSGMIGKAPLLQNPSTKDKLPPAPFLENQTFRAEVTKSSSKQVSSPDKSKEVKKDQFMMPTFRDGVTLGKALSFGKGDGAKIRGLTCSPFHLRSSRSYNRFTLLDEFDDSDFACHFADDEYITRSGNRTECSKGKGQLNENLGTGGLVAAPRSSDAVLGELVRLLRTAAPLVKDAPHSVNTHQTQEDETRKQKNQPKESTNEHDCGSALSSEVAESRFLKSKTAGQALEELLSYQNMKASLIRKGGTASSDETFLPKSGSAPS